MSEQEKLDMERTTVEQVFNKFKKTRQDIKRAYVLKFNNENPESSAERIFLAKHQKKGRVRKPLSDDNEV